MSEWGKGDTNATLELTIYKDLAKTLPKDVSGANSIVFLTKNPDLVVFSTPASLSTTGLDGRVRATFDSADIMVEGKYGVQVKLDGTPWSGQSSTYEFTIRETNEVI